MSEVLTRIEKNCTTGEEIIHILTPEEIADMQAVQAQIEAERAAQLAEEQARAEAKASAEAKLAALGLTAEEIAAL